MVAGTGGAGGGSRHRAGSADDDGEEEETERMGSGVAEPNDALRAEAEMSENGATSRGAAIAARAHTRAHAHARLSLRSRSTRTLQFVVLRTRSAARGTVY